jgi:hypothetical protein
MHVTAGRSRRRWVARTLALAALAVGVALVGAVIARESSPPPELTATRVATSLMDEINSAGLEDEGTCVQQQHGRWTCDVPDTSGSGGATYRVTATSEGCWRARRTKLYGEQAPQTASACLH